MKTAYHVKITTQAQAQLWEIARYIREELKAPDAALRLMDALETSMASLARFPHSVALTDEEPWRGYGIHRMPVKHFLVYFWIDEDTGKVQVTAIVYGKRDQMRQLSQMDME